MKKDVVVFELSGVFLTSNTFSTRPDYLTVQPMKDCFSAVAAVKSLVDHMFILYKSHAKENYGKAMNWLRHHRFFEHTTLSSENILYCETEMDIEDIVSNLKTTVFITDDVRLCNKVKPCQSFLINDKEKLMQHEENYVTKIISWKEFPKQLVDHLLKTASTDKS